MQTKDLKSIFNQYCESKSYLEIENDRCYYNSTEIWHLKDLKMYRVSTFGGKFNNTFYIMTEKLKPIAIILGWCLHAYITEDYKNNRDIYYWLYFLSSSDYLLYNKEVSCGVLPKNSTLRTEDDVDSKLQYDILNELKFKRNTEYNHFGIEITEYKTYIKRSLKQKFEDVIERYDYSNHTTIEQRLFDKYPKIIIKLNSEDPLSQSNYNNIDVVSYCVFGEWVELEEIYTSYMKNNKRFNIELNDTDIMVLKKKMLYEVIPMIKNVFNHNFYKDNGFIRIANYNKNLKYDDLFHKIHNTNDWNLTIK